MKIEAVVTRVDYADFLAETLPHHRSMFDHMVVVTSPEDHATQRVCEFWNVQCHVTDSFDSRWGSFKKALGINEGLQLVSKDDWVIHLDADIVCPPLTRQLLSGADLDPAYIYGFDRHIVTGEAEWRKFMSLPQLQQENQTWIHLDKFPVGTRLMMGGGIPGPQTGYIPLGFAQLWNPSVSKVYTYPTEHTTAAKTDVQFALRWPRSRRGFIPEIILYHLESVNSSPGANWSGRTTAPFSIHQGELRPAVSKPRRTGAKTPIDPTNYCP